MLHTTMLAEYILNYLAKTEQSVEDALLKPIFDEASARFEKVTRRQFFERKERDTVGKYHPSGATKCQRQNGLRMQGAEAEALSSEVRLKFWYGDILELGMIALGQLAYTDTPHSIGMNNEDVMVKLGKKYQGEHRGYIDGAINFNHKWHLEKYGVDLRRTIKDPWEEFILLELKSMDAWSYSNFKKSGPDDVFGYMGQISKYQQAIESRRYLYLATDKQKGGIHEHVGVYNKKYIAKADEIYDVVMEAAERDTIPNPPRDYELFHWAPSMGRLELGLNCSYCSYKRACVEALGGKLGMTETRGRQGPKPVFFIYQEAMRTEPRDIADGGFFED